MFGKKKDMTDIEKKAKLSALKGANGMASKMMKDGLDGAKKVSIMSDSPEGLKKGLDAAKKVVGQIEDEDSELSESMEDAHEGYEDQQDESMPMSLEEIDEKIKELLELKEQLE